MASPTNRERVLRLIRTESGLTDSEIRLRTGIEPHQQVNQICRALASAGLTKRVPGPSRRIVNVPASATGASAVQPPATGRPEVGHTTQAVTSESIGSRHSRTAGSVEPIDLSDSLVVIPCSGVKRSGDTARTATSVLDDLPDDLATELSHRRSANEEAAGIDESTLLPAVERYNGSLYTAGRAGISRLAAQGARVLIVSGGYGLVLVNESIGMYEQVLRPAMWPTRLIERCLAAFARETGVRHVIGVLSATTGYATVFRRTRWPGRLEDVMLASPESTTGAMVKAPRAQGEWLTAMAEMGGLPQSWSSSDGLRMEISVL